MIGFSASFAKVIKLLLDELKKNDKDSQHVFSTIIKNIETGEHYFEFEYPIFKKLNEILTYNGFDVEIIKQIDNSVIFLVKW